MDIRKIGTLAAGTLMLGAALLGPVSAAMDATGLTKGFFYDANMNPLAQIVVGENPKASPLDAVAAGNIAATIGNLAYMTQDVSTGEGGAEGEVVISTESTESVGDYIQDTNVDSGLACTGGTENLPDFWEDNDRLWFDGDETYEPGDFTIYNVACGRQTEREANILKEAEYKNVYCLFCETLCKEGLEFDVSHEMEESIYVDSSKISYYEDGLGTYDSESLKMEIEKGTIRYRVDAGYIPLQKITDATTGDELDFEYRGKILLFGEEYYVTDVKNPGSTTNTEIHLAKGKVLDDISNEGYTAEYNGYKFKIDHLIYSAEYVVAGILLDVQKPDGTVVQVQVSKMANGEVDDLEIAGVTAEESAAVATGSILVYDMTTEVVLEDNEDLVLNGEEKKYWKVSFTKAEANAVGSDISEYGGAVTGQKVLQYVDITYQHDLDGAEALEVDESLDFPNNFKLTFRGYLDTHYEKSPVSGAGEGDIVVERGSEDYQLVMSFTGEDNNRYDDVRLDEGPFGVGNYFMLNGEVYQFTEVEEENETAYVVTIDPAISGTREKITVNAIEETYGITTDLTVRFLALVDALDDDDPSELYKDEEEELTYEDLYATSTGVPGGMWMIYDDSTSTITFLDPVTGMADSNVEVNPNVAMSGNTFDGFQVDDNTLEMALVKETGTDGSLQTPQVADADAAGLAADLNQDGDDEDVLVAFANDDGEVFYLDFSDRNYDEVINGYYYDNNVWYDCDTTDGVYSAANGDMKIDKDEDTLLMLPQGGDEIEIDWGVDYLVESVKISHPQDKVDVTYFIGKEETTSTLEETITKAAEGTDVSAGCCTFHVAKFGVTGIGEGATVSTDKVNLLSVEDLGKLVVGESAADTTKNLVLVGGPVVNAMAGEVITADDIAAEPDRYLVKKLGTKLVVAGWEKADTIEAGNALVKWLQENIHA